MARTVLFLYLIIFATQSFAQPFQSIRGTVLDYASNAPLPFATVVVLGTNPVIGAITDSSGNFQIQNIPVGRYDLQVEFTGYEPAMIREIIVASAKQNFLTIQLRENISVLGEVVVRPRVSKELPINAMATVSARMLSVEDAKRYAGGFDDPARLAASFAGVAGNTDQNGIIVRGNAPRFLQWKMEGVEIPNPNHFGDLNSFGGGALTALSSQMLSNSDFFTGAFPAEYSNALSGVFDIGMRTGNNQKRENTFQAGIIGIDASSEGPFKKGNRASYLFNYRYSTFALLGPLLPDDADGIKYQDLSFKLNFPTKRAGIFSVWGIGLRDRAGAKANIDSAEWQYSRDSEEDEMKQYMGAAGISHKYLFSKNTYVKTSLAGTVSSTDWATQKLNHQLSLQPKSMIENKNWNIVLSSFINKKFSAKHTNRTGISLTGMLYDIKLNSTPASDGLLREIVKSRGNSTLVSGYSSSSFNLTTKLLMNIGINSQYFTLNNKYTIEPRLGFRQQVGGNQSIGFAYGLHSRIEKLNYYFNNSLLTGETAVNKHLDFTKAHHFVLSYDWKITDLIHFKIEPYFQKLFSVPVIPDSSFSFINLHNDWFFAEKLQSTGGGRNYGLDITIEKYISEGYYYLFTASVFNSEYKGGDGVWRNTRFNRNYVFNILFGKEWKAGKNKQNIFSLNTRFCYQGGNRYSPVNEAASHLVNDIVYDETNAFKMQAQSSLNVHFTASYKINRKESSREIAFKILNLTGQPDFYGYQYNQIDNRISKEQSIVIIPNLSYKIEF
ncbi:carboxypeptidase regulatory-like domain-containing protein [Flavihumibacter stibioxidans]|uniref:Prevent-host-death protein n=1 Tax=Flavihumibacter stibioxidans TaxID=1834163 RepID=A0ABR7MAK1_9BACT|nr:carboxypeptidase-like regulatory domain-containing protein [Flavihumibacter stibioxidans]MBC6492064.1 prevent-host-death protein [Flavihumibacter stibioxidans]